MESFVSHMHLETKGGMEANSAGMIQDATKPAASRQQQQQEQQQGEEEQEEEEEERERFEVVLSKPSNKQKLGMVLKHAQLHGEKRLKSGAYLHALAEDSLAQEAGLVPRDRLVLVEGLDVKMLPFDRIVGLIRRADFPLTLVWSRERAAGQAGPSPPNSDGSSASGGSTSGKTTATNATATSEGDAASPAASAGAEDWAQATHRSRPASTVSREAEAEVGGGAEETCEGNVRLSSNSSSGLRQQQQQMQRAPIGEPMEAGLERDQAGKHDVPPRRHDEEQVQERQRRKGAAVGSMRPKRRRSSPQQQQQQQQVMEGDDDTGAGAIGSRSRSSSSSSNGMGSDGPADALAAAEARASGEAIKTEQGAEAPNSRRREDGSAGLAEGLRREDGIADGTSGGGGDASSNSNIKSQVHQDAPSESANGKSGRVAGRGGGRGKGSRRGRGAVRGGRSRGRGSGAAATAAGNAVDPAAAAAAAAGAASGEVGMEGVAPPDWLGPLMKTKLGDFEGTRYARSKLKLTVSHEWAQQEYRTGIASSGRLGHSITETEFIRRRLGGGSLYAMLEQESRDYLRVGPFTDADMELLGKSFAEVQAHKELPPRATPTSDMAAAASSKATGTSKDKASTAPTMKTGKAGGGKAAAIAAAGAKDAAAGAADSGSISWADRLRDFQIDLPASTSFSGLAPDSADEDSLAAGVGKGGGKGGGGSSLDAGEVELQGGGKDDDPLAWDGVGVDPLTVLHHRKHFDVRCREYEALNNSSKKDKTNVLMGRTHTIHQEHTSIISAKRGTLEGTLQNVRQQLNGREEQLRHVHIDQRAVNPLDTAVVARLNENAAMMRTRVAEKKVQMAMIMDEANKVLQWEQTKELARREAINHAAEMHGHGGSFTAGASRERNELMQCLVAQKANIMLLSTFCKLRGPWLAPPEYVEAGRPMPATAATASSAETEDSAGFEANTGKAPAVVEHGDTAAAAAASLAVAVTRERGGTRRSSATGDRETGCESNESNSDSPTNAARGSDAGSVTAAAAAAAAGTGAGAGAKSGKRPIKLRLLPPSGGDRAKMVTGGDQEVSPRSAVSSSRAASVAAAVHSAGKEAASTFSAAEARGNEGQGCADGGDGGDSAALTDAEASMTGPAASESVGRSGQGKEGGGGAGGGGGRLPEAGNLSPVVPPGTASAEPPARAGGLSDEIAAAVPSSQKTMAGGGSGGGGGEGEDLACDVDMVGDVARGCDGMDVDTEVDEWQVGTVLGEVASAD